MVALEFLHRQRQGSDGDFGLSILLARTYHFMQKRLGNSFSFTDSTFSISLTLAVASAQVDMYDFIGSSVFFFKEYICRHLT